MWELDDGWRADADVWQTEGSIAELMRKAYRVALAKSVEKSASLGTDLAHETHYQYSTSVNNSTGLSDKFQKEIQLIFAMHVKLKPMLHKITCLSSVWEFKSRFAMYFRDFNHQSFHFTYLNSIFSFSITYHFYQQIYFHLFEHCSQSKSNPTRSKWRRVNLSGSNLL